MCNLITEPIYNGSHSVGFMRPSNRRTIHLKELGVDSIIKGAAESNRVRDCGLDPFGSYFQQLANGCEK